jgi:hypothetical protein
VAVKFFSVRTDLKNEDVAKELGKFLESVNVQQILQSTGTITTFAGTATSITLITVIYKKKTPKKQSLLQRTMLEAQGKL